MESIHYAKDLDDSLPGEGAKKFGKKRVKAPGIYQFDLIGQAAVGVAYEIRNPLTVIKGYLQLVKNKPEYCLQESLGILFQEVERMETLLTNFILLARSKTVGKTPQNLNHVLKELYPAIQTYAVRHGIVTELLLGDRVPVMDFDVEEIRQLVMNLVQNGIEAMRPRHRLTIETARRPGQVVLYVGDEGDGISPEQMEKIFDPFYTTKMGSAGLGLVISSRIVQRHHGEMEIVSKVGEGTTVCVTFPIPER